MMDRCDAIRDDLPLLAQGVLEPVRAQQIEQHLQTCADCRDEHALVALLRAPLVAPAGLAERTLRATGSTSAPGNVRPWRTAVAAAVAVLAIGTGALLLTRSQDDYALLENGDAAAFGWATRSDPVLHGGVGLEALTDDELELLLAEMQS